MRRRRRLGDAFTIRARKLLAGLFDKAIEQYRKADDLWLKKEPKDKDRKYNLLNWAWALRSQKFYEQAAEKCQEAVYSDPNDPITYTHLGMVLAAGIALTRRSSSSVRRTSGG